MIPNPLEPYFVMAVIAAVFLAIYLDKLRPSVSLLLAVLLFSITGILTPDEVLAGFSNTSIASIILLILITAGLRKSFNIGLLFDNVFKGAHSYQSFLLRMMAKVAAISSIVNNTPVVALMTPFVFGWGKKHNISPSKLLMPMSFAAIFGGMITLIGTSTTLVLNGFLIDNGIAQLQSLDLAVIGLLVTTTGILFIGLLGYKLLPEHTDILESFKKNVREYLVETQLNDNSPLIGKTIKEAGLRNLKGVYLVEIIRDDRIISPVEPTEEIQKGDLLIFAGETEDIVDLINSSLALKLPEQTQVGRMEKVDVVEAVTSPNSEMIGKRVKDSDFRAKYDAAIVAVHRNGEKLGGKIGELRLLPGDLLLLFAGPDFNSRAGDTRDIYVVNNLREIVKPSKKKRIMLLILVAVAVFLLLLDIFQLFTSLMIIFFIMAAFRMISLQDIRRELDLNMISILVFSLAIGQALVKTGAGNILAAGLLDILQPYGSLAVIIGLLLLTTALTSFITNVGAVSITFPLAYSISEQLGMNGAPFYLAVAYAASAAFLTPIAYQTNLIIYGPGGYKFQDFFRIGLPVTIVYLLTVVGGLLIMYGHVL